jgi:uncharacterized protein (TIGR03067 family)
MRSHIVLFLATAGLALAADAKDDAKKELEKLQGTWVMVSSERGGKKMSEDEVKAFQRTVKGDEYIVLHNGETLVKGTFTIDPTKKPKTIDALRSEGENKDTPMRGIYEIDGDTYKVCFAPPGMERPTEFVSKEGSMHVISVWKRQAK